MARLFRRVIVSLDSADETGYRAIRGIQAFRAFPAIALAFGRDADSYAAAVVAAFFAAMI